MSTRTIMKAEMASILKRDDLTVEIGEAISHAINVLKSEKFWFLETISKTFSTVAAQVYYTGSDDADIPLMESFDDIQIRVSGNDYSLGRMDKSEFEEVNDASVASGAPVSFVYAEKKIGLYPVPDDAYTVTMIGHYRTAEPSTDGEADNVWMTYDQGYYAVFYEALSWINEVHIRDYELSNRFRGHAERAKDGCYTRTNRLKSTNQITPTTW